jgi:Amt family ammonium transporter
MGAVAERGRLIPALVFIFLWATLVYCPIACWVWNINGWAFKYGVLDYAGGGPVEIASGMSALAYSMVLGKRQEKMMLNFRPHNVSLITLGTILLWFGWLGFNGGSAFGANLRAVMACWNSCLTAMFGLPPGEEVVYGWLVLRMYFWLGCCYTCFWFHHPLGIHHSWCCDWFHLQFCYQRYLSLLTTAPLFCRDPLTHHSQVLDSHR